MGVPVVPTSARSGDGLFELVDIISDMALGRVKLKPKLVRYEDEVEKAIAKMEPRVREIIGEHINARWVALRLIDGDTKLVRAMERYYNSKELNRAGRREVLA